MDTVLIVHAECVKVNLSNPGDAVAQKIFMERLFGFLLTSFLLLSPYVLPSSVRLCLLLSDISLFFPSPSPPLSLCNYTDSPSSGTLQHSRLDFLSHFLSHRQIRELVSSLFPPPPPPLLSPPICVCVLWVTLVVSRSTNHATCTACQV